MLKQVGLYWRIFGTGLSFVLFGAGGLVLRAMAFPLINLCVRQPDRRIAAARNTVRLTFLFFVNMMRGLGVLSYEIRGLGKLQRPGLLILANHPTLIDTVFLMAFIRQANCIVKSGLWANPFTGGPVRAAGYIRNEEGPALLESCIASLAAGHSLIIFPEGTRTPRNGEIRFKRGAANIAVRGMQDITPVVIRCTPPTLSKGEKWWHVPVRKPHFVIEVCDDIIVHSVVGQETGDALAARQLTDYLQGYFAEENHRHAVA